MKNQSQVKKIRKGEKETSLMRWLDKAHLALLCSVLFSSVVFFFLLSFLTQKIWAVLHGPASLVVAQLWDKRAWRHQWLIIQENSHIWSRSWNDTFTIHGREHAGRATICYPRAKRLPFIGIIDVRSSHQLPGRPAAKAGGKHVRSY